MRKVDLTILLLVLLFVGGFAYLEFAVPKQTNVVLGPAIRVVQKEYDTLEIIKKKYKTLHDTQIFIQSKYETLFVAYHGDTSCAATRRIIAMHRFLDSCGK
jgi:hypothetical protein